MRPVVLDDGANSPTAAGMPPFPQQRKRGLFIAGNSFIFFMMELVSSN